MTRVLPGLLLAALLTLPAAAFAQTPREARPARNAATALNGNESLARHLDAALALDAGFRTLLAQRDAAAARGAQLQTPFAGSPFVGGSARTDVRGPNRVGEFDLEAGAPLWLPGQRGALGDTVQRGVLDVEGRIALRRLEVAGALREAWWEAAEARRSAQLARERLATARQIGQSVARRAQLGDIPPTEALLARNEVLAAELALAQAEAAAQQTVAAYRAVTGGLEPNLAPEAPRPNAVGHPAIVAAQASLAAAEARQRLVAATPRDNPEVALFGRQETGNLSSEGTSLGVRFRLPLATEARNAPRRAEAQSEVTRAAAELAQARRLVEAEVGRARLALEAAEGALRLARARLAVAQEQEGIALRAFAAGETGTFDLYRVRQLRLEAANDEGRAVVEAARARSRLNQAAGVIP